MPKAYKAIKDNLKLPKIIHIIGTNGKGSTGRFLAYILFKSGKSVGHYTSPHILKFNERVWINGKDIDDESLEKAHQKLLKILPKKFQKSLSYFEYTTLLAMVAFENVEYAILEAGLGGEFDATNVFDKELSLITLIDFDHQSFLGENIKDIASTKIRSIQKEAILGYQKYDEVKEVAKKIAENKNAKLYEIEEILTSDEIFAIKRFVKEKGLPSFFVDNFSLAATGAKKLSIELDLQKVKDIKIFGRMQKIAKNITIDVGHNKAAAKAIEKELKEKVVLVYNSYEDKDYEEILKILKPKIKKVEIIDIKDDRIVKKEILIDALKKLNIKYQDFKNIKKDENYLIFGSFKVIETFLKLRSRTSNKKE
ncbi:bifunctional folylpolyglutamate synthase/dihydrofolate synthase [Nitrosophilus kaiyonis]|uniref:bifunctional folylpolyglutamate synthase/dihydrofolate synthase n=1 Tax=Nitrosophilus kaiyonis TaxID=2930200 RepID=UPI00249134D1|nr:bifunctional folylpolyglutamate synthase/dihydrofolate synthase [Nitrosophilus kaiyonis]